MNTSGWPPPRKITAYELALIERLLIGKPEGGERWLSQIKDAEVCQTDGEGTIFFKDALHLAGKLRTAIVNGQYKDADGVTVCYLLHITEDQISELETYKESGSPIIRRPHPSEIEVFH
jgi:hypothetical protein